MTPSAQERTIHFWSSASDHEIREKARDISRWVAAAPVRKFFYSPAKQYDTAD
jgi:hypothetical protein